MANPSWEDGRGPAASALTITVSRPRAGTVVCTAVGEVDLTTAPSLLEQLQKATSDGLRHLVVNLSGVTFLSARGVGVLVETWTAQQDRCAMTLVGNSRPVTRVLDMLAELHLTPPFQRYDHISDAAAACNSTIER
ncbi:MAG: STAS domain-containing protein [Actinomycetota bacterium]|nr:STAS domain-containing protein [Actinomycetota bacterium]